MMEERFYELLERVYWSMRYTSNKPKLVYYLKMEGFSESEIKMLLI